MMLPPQGILSLDSYASVLELLLTVLHHQAVTSDGGTLTMDDVLGCCAAKAFEGMEPPARACFAVKTLPKNALVEIEAIAEIP